MNPRVARFWLLPGLLAGVSVFPAPAEELDPTPGFRHYQLSAAAPALFGLPARFLEERLCEPPPLDRGDVGSADCKIAEVKLAGGGVSPGGGLPISLAAFLGTATEAGLVPLGLAVGQLSLTTVTPFVTSCGAWQAEITRAETEPPVVSWGELAVAAPGGGLFVGQVETLVRLLLRDGAGREVEIVVRLRLAAGGQWELAATPLLPGESRLVLSRGPGGTVLELRGPCTRLPIEPRSSEAEGPPPET